MNSILPEKEKTLYALEKRIPIKMADGEISDLARQVRMHCHQLKEDQYNEQKEHYYQQRHSGIAGKYNSLYKDLQSLKRDVTSFPFEREINEQAHC